MVLSKENLFLADPYNDAHIEAITKFEEEYKIKNKISEELKKIKNSIPRSQYVEDKKKSNNITSYIYLEEKGKIKDECHIQGVKDIKKCTITFAPIHDSEHNSFRKKIILQAEKYAFQILGMEEVFLKVDQTDKNIVDNLESEYENLGEDNGKILFLKEKELSEKKERNKGR